MIMSYEASKIWIKQNNHKIKWYLYDPDEGSLTVDYYDGSRAVFKVVN